MRKLVPLVLIASIALVGCGAAGSTADKPSSTPDISTGFGTEPTSEVAPQ